MPCSDVHIINNICSKIVKVVFLYLLLLQKKQKFPNVVYSVGIMIKKNNYHLGNSSGRTNLDYPYSDRNCSAHHITIRNARFGQYPRSILSNDGLFNVQSIRRIKVVCKNGPMTRPLKFYIENFHCAKKVIQKIYSLQAQPRWKNVNFMKKLSKIYMIEENYEEIINRINNNVIRRALGSNCYEDDGHRSNTTYSRENYDQNSLLEIVNTQTEIPINLPHFEKEVRKLIHLMKYKDFQLNITFVSLKDMKNLNRIHRGKNEPTDVISLLHYVSSDEGISSNCKSAHDDISGRRYLRSGDIYLCPAYINKECILSRIRYEREIMDKANDESGDRDNQRIDDEAIGERGESSDGNMLENHDHDYNHKNEEEMSLRGVNKLFNTLFCVNQRLPLYVLHGLIHLSNKDHVNNMKEYNEFMDIEEEMIEKYLKFHHYTHTFYSHYVIGVGTDILNVNRIYKILQKKNEAFFLKKVLSSLEMREFEQGIFGTEVYTQESYGLADEKSKDENRSDYSERRNRCYSHGHSGEALTEKCNINYTLKLAIHVSKKFAAKEAILKCMGRGLSSISKYGLSMNDIEIRNDKYGKPHVILYNKAHKIANEMGIVNIFLSISDEKITCSNHNIMNDQSAMCNFCTYLIHAQALSVGSNV
ncbi:holo-(acyl-carrier protein) synthase [Plasmodium gonderi]|uniref:Holo-(Acyl-carrier protein) synthase n=1 Tax=Plasmodium gonderi TaxID=77519 RepID=A0A1Y1JF37_PLAGO|nr:holo-(acyl-carrier protein) synthase [Plasmodium gonderi]GAW79827.1 holo-(acyl-carrier protein) synthase [Plasmodium gonderi]